MQLQSSRCHVHGQVVLLHPKIPGVSLTDTAVLNYRFELQVQKKVSAHQLSSDANLVPLGNGDSDIYKRNDVSLVSPTQGIGLS